MRAFILSTVLLLPLPGLAAGDFNGAWVASICPSGAQRSAGECANFVLELMEKDGKLCGSHMFATAGAARIDEGAAPSLTADLVESGEGAAGTAVSNLSATPVRMRVELKLDKGALRWTRIDNPSGDHLLPKTARLKRSNKRTLFAPLFEQELRAACTYVFNLAAAQATTTGAGVQGRGASTPVAAPGQ